MTALRLRFLRINIEEINLKITCMQIFLLTIHTAFKEKTKTKTKPKCFYRQEKCSLDFDSS